MMPSKQNIFCINLSMLSIHLVGAFNTKSFFIAYTEMSIF